MSLPDITQRTPPGEPEKIRAFLSAQGWQDFEVAQLAGDASVRRYYRVREGGRSAILMAWEPFVDDGSYPQLSVHRQLEKHGVRVPVFSACDPARGFILQEDLGDTALEQWFTGGSDTLPHNSYLQALDELVKIHGPASADRAQRCTAFEAEFDVEKLLWEMNYTRQHLLHGICGATLSDRTAQELQQVFTGVGEQLQQDPKVIQHRDYHSRNILLQDDGVRIIDYQDARLGVVQYDLVSLLRDSYVVIDPVREKELLNYYLSAAGEKGIAAARPALRNHFFHIYEVQAVQRCFKAAGSFAGFYRRRADTRYLKYLPYTLRTVRRTLQQLPEFALLDRVLEDSGAYDFDYLALCAP